MRNPWGDPRWYYVGVDRLVADLLSTRPFTAHLDPGALDPPSGPELRGRAVRWKLASHYVVWIAADKIRFMEGNQWNLGHARALYDLIAAGYSPALDMPAGRVSRIDEREIAASLRDDAKNELAYQRDMEKPWGPGDLNTLTVQLLDGNHRALAAIAAGETEIPVICGENYRENVRPDEWVAVPKPRPAPKRRTRKNPDEDLRALERRAAAGDVSARRALRAEWRRRGIPDPTWHGARKLHQRANEIQLVDELANDIYALYQDEMEYAAESGDPEPLSLSDVGDHVRQNISDDGPRHYFGLGWSNRDMPYVEALIARAVRMLRDREARANPGDEAFRELERAAALGDEAALVRIGYELNRHGLCARCRQPRPLEAMLRRDERIKICGLCSAETELVALEASTDTYTGYVGAAHPDPVGPLPPSAHAARRRYVITFNDFPLVAILFSDVFQQRGRRSSGDHVIMTWRGIDRWGREWYGRNAGPGMVTGMRLRKIPVPGPMARSSGVRTISPVRGAEYEAVVLGRAPMGDWLRDDVVESNRLAYAIGAQYGEAMEVLREQQRRWIERSERGEKPWGPTREELMAEREQLVAALWTQGGRGVDLAERIDEITRALGDGEQLGDEGFPRRGGHDQCTECGEMFDAPAHFAAPVCARCRGRGRG